MKYEALALEFLGLIFSTIGFLFLLKSPFPLIFSIDPKTGEEVTRPNKNFKEDYYKWNKGIRISLIGFVLQGMAVWLQIAFT